MNKFLFVVSFVFMFFSMNAIAEDKPIEIDGKHILVTDFKVANENKLKIKPEDEKSVFVYLSYPNRYAYPNARKIVESIFSSKGYKISDKFENAKYSIFLNFNGSLDISKADKYAANSYVPNAGQVATHVGALANSVLSGGVNGAAGWVIAELLQTDSYSTISGSLRKDAVLKKGFFGEKLTGSDDEIYGGTARVFYKLEKGKEASDDIVLKMVVNEWIDHFMPTQNVNTQIADTKPVETPAPVVTNTTPALIPAETTQPQVQ